MPFNVSVEGDTNFSIANVSGERNAPLEDIFRVTPHPCCGTRKGGTVRAYPHERVGQSGAAGARAFTVGRDVVLGEGEYASASKVGLRLLVHKLDRVLQRHDVTGCAAAEVVGVGAPGDPWRRFSRGGPPEQVRYFGL
jgi:hypothetical protein